MGCGGDARRLVLGSFASGLGRYLVRGGDSVPNKWASNGIVSIGEEDEGFKVVSTEHCLRGVNNQF